MQSWSLNRKILVTQARIMEWYIHYDGKVYISFSGGKDSTVLLDIARKIYPDIEVAFVDTGLEYPELKEFVKTIDNVMWLKPTMNFKQVIQTYGYPLISKESASKIYYARKAKERGDIKAYNRYANGIRTSAETGKQYKFMPLSKLANMLLGSNIPVSNRCCDVMKKSPVKKYERRTGRKPIVATMAGESRQRRDAWLKNGCNAFNAKRPISQPMSFWTEQDILEYISRYKIHYASVYGEIKQDENGKYYTTGCDRTGCVFCGFGCHLEKEPNRFQRLKQTHPKLWKYCMRDMDKGGLGMQEVLDYIGVKIE